MSNWRKTFKRQRNTREDTGSGNCRRNCPGQCEVDREQERQRVVGSHRGLWEDTELLLPDGDILWGVTYGQN